MALEIGFLEQPLGIEEYLADAGYLRSGSSNGLSVFERAGYPTLYLSSSPGRRWTAQRAVAELYATCSTTDYVHDARMHLMRQYIMKGFRTLWRDPATGEYIGSAREGSTKYINHPTEQKTHAGGQGVRDRHHSSHHPHSHLQRAVQQAP